MTVAARTTLATVQVFLSFASHDKKAAEDLWTRLRLALVSSREYRWELWTFTDQLLAGEDFDDDIQAALGRAELGVFALSNAFLASSYITTVELPPFLSPGAGKRVVPIALKALPGTADLRGLQSRQIFCYDEPYYAGRAPHAREIWANRLADELHRVARRYRLGH